jgi:hypothetical protein
MAPPFIACTDIGMSPCPGDEDDREFPFCPSKLPLKIETALAPRQSDIEHQAGGTIRADPT